MTTHVNDIAHKISEALKADGMGYTVSSAAPDEPDLAAAFPKRDGTWVVYAAEGATRGFLILVGSLPVDYAYQMVDEANDRAEVV